MPTPAWIAAASAVIAAAAFTFSIWTKTNERRATAIRDWQRVALYALIESGGPVGIRELKAGYLEQAQQFGKLPNKEIQDAALHRILLDLQRDGVIIRNDDGKYQVQLKLPMEAWTFDWVKRTAQAQELQPKIIRLVEAEDGKYTVDALVRKLVSEGDHVSFEMVDSVVYGIRGGSIKLNRDQKLEFVPPYNERENTS